MKFLVVLFAVAACGYAAPDRRPQSYNPAPPAYAPRPAYPAPKPAYPAPKPAYPAPQPAYVAAPQEQSYSYAQPKKVVAILSQDFQLDNYGYKYNYESEDYQNKQETGKVIPGSKKGPYGEDEDGSLQVQGSYYYQSPDGTPITLTYTADENGFQPQGDHLPTPPPLPQALVDAIAKHEAATAAVAQYSPAPQYAPAPAYEKPAPAPYQPAASYQRPLYSRYQQ